MTIAELEFASVCRLDDLPEGRPVSATGPLGDAICLLRNGAEIRAFADSCPHRGHPLSAGSCEDGVLRCALHGWEFDARDGQALSPAAPFALQSIPARVRRGTVEVGAAS